MDYGSVKSYVYGMALMLFVVYGIYFLRISPPNRLKKVLGCIMVAWSVLLFKDVLYFHDFVITHEHVYKTLMMIDNWAVALCYIYAMELLKPGGMTWGKAFLAMSGFVLFTALYAISGSETVYVMNMAFTSVYCVAVSIYIVVNTVRYNRMLKNMYSDLTRVNVKWLYEAVALMLLNYCFWAFIYFVDDAVSDICYYVLLCGVWTLVACNTDRQIVPSCAEASEAEEALDAPLQDEGEKNFPFAERLESMMSSGYFCENPQLTLQELADELNTNRTTLSAYINKELGTTFYDLINRVRLEYAESLLRDASLKLTQDELAAKAGFNSLSTFLRAFRKKYEMSPNEYRARNVQ